MNEVAVKSNDALMNEVLIKGDLKGLTEAQRTSYYMKVCESVGLNPLTKPFEYITLNGKMTLYALRGCTDQLRTVHGVSVVDMQETERDGVFIVTVKVSNKEGRTDMAKGAVNITGLKGEALANALMKAETKAKRRATLSICGLGLLDETEIETIPGAVNLSNITPSDTDTSKPASPFKNAALRTQFVRNVQESLKNAKTEAELNDILALNKEKLELMANSGVEADQLGVDGLRNDYVLARKRLQREEQAAIDELNAEEAAAEAAGLSSQLMDF